MVYVIKQFISAYKMLTSQDGRLFTYAFAYSLIIAVAPLIIVSVVLASYFIFDADTIIHFLSMYIPSEFILPFVNYIKGSAPTDLVVIISLSSVSLWVSSRTVYSFLLESSRNDAIGVRSFVLRIVAMIYMIFFLALAGGIVYVFSYVPVIPFVTKPLIVWVLMMMFYRTVSFRFAKFKDVYLGSIFASLGILTFGQLFFVYINQYSNYETIYGPMASLMILLISVYWLSWFVYGGYCINVSFYAIDSGKPHKKKWLERFIDSSSKWTRKRDN